MDQLHATAKAVTMEMEELKTKRERPPNERTLPSPARSRWRFRVAAALVSVIFALAVGEITLRVLKVPWEWTPHLEPWQGSGWSDYVHRPSSAPGLTYELAPNVDRNPLGFRVRTNHLGMRSPEISEIKPKGVRRIIVLGDSITFGLTVEQDRIYASVLQDLLDRSGQGRFEVVNMAVSGYSAREEVALFFHRGAALDPDLIVIGYCLNDPGAEPFQPLKMFYQPVSWWMHSNLLRLGRKAVNDLEIRWWGDGDYHAYLSSKPSYWNTVVESFERLAEWSRANKVPVLVMIFPDLQRFDEDPYPYRAIHGKVAALAEQDGFAALDLSNAFSRFDQTALMVRPDDSHPSALGHHLAAEALFAELPQRFPHWFAPGPAPVPAVP